MAKPTKGRNSDLHWRPQVDFLVYKTYDDYFQVENMQLAAKRLKSRIGVEIKDARPLTAHGTDRFELLNDTNHADTLPHEIFAMRQKGLSPSHASLYDNEITAMVAQAYAADIALYKKLFGAEYFMFDQPGQPDPIAMASSAA